MLPQTQCGRHQEHERRQYPTYAPLIKTQEGEFIPPYCGLDNSSYQLATDNEENIYANEAPLGVWNIKMKCQHTQDRNRTQSIDITPARH